MIGAPFADIAVAPAIPRVVEKPRDGIVAAGAVVPEGKVFPPGSLIMGVPAKVMREVTAEDREQIAAGARHYQERARLYRSELGHKETAG